MWRKVLFNFFKKEKSEHETMVDPMQQGMFEEQYVIAKCIGCGQCQHGCPVRVKVKVKKKTTIS